MTENLDSINDLIISLITLCPVLGLQKLRWKVAILIAALFRSLSIKALGWDWASFVTSCHHYSDMNWHHIYLGNWLEAQFCTCSFCRRKRFSMNFIIIGILAVYPSLASAGTIYCSKPYWCVAFAWWRRRPEIWVSEVALSWMVWVLCAARASMACVAWDDLASRRCDSPASCSSL